MKPISGSASRAATSCVTWSSLVKWCAWRLAVSVRPTPGTSRGMSPTRTSSPRCIVSSSWLIEDSSPPPRGIEAPTPRSPRGRQQRSGRAMPRPVTGCSPRAALVMDLSSSANQPRRTPPCPCNSPVRLEISRRRSVIFARACSAALHASTAVSHAARVVSMSAARSPCRARTLSSFSCAPIVSGSTLVCGRAAAARAAAFATARGAREWRASSAPSRSSCGSPP